MEDNQTEIRMMYRDLTNGLRVKYNSHYNLYQKQQLEEKIKCYKNNTEKPELYYRCIASIDEKMSTNSQALQQKFNQIEIDDKSCQGKCQESFTLDEGKRNACLIKCMEELKLKAYKLQDQFYQAMLQNNPEYKKIKK